MFAVPGDREWPNAALNSFSCFASVVFWVVHCASKLMFQCSFITRNWICTEKTQPNGNGKTFMENRVKQSQFDTYRKIVLEAKNVCQMWLHLKYKMQMENGSISTNRKHNGHIYECTQKTMTMMIKVRDAKAKKQKNIWRALVTRAGHERFHFVHSRVLDIV